MFIVLYGSEPFLAKQKLKEIIGNYKKTQTSGLNLSMFESGNFSLDDFKSAIETVSMFDEKKLVVIKNVFLEDKEFAKGVIEICKKYGVQDSKDVVVIFFDGGEPSKNKDFDDLIKRPNLVQEFKKLEGVALNNWIKKEFEKLATDIDTKAVLLLARSAGDDMHRLRNEIDKLASYKKIITEDDVAKMVAVDFHPDIFSVIDAIAKKDKKLSFKILNDHISHGESEIYLLTMIVYQFRSLIRVKSLTDKSLGESEIAKKTGLHPFVVKKSLAISRLFSLDELKNIYQKLFEIDLKIKTGEIEPQMALNMFVAEL